MSEADSLTDTFESDRVMCPALATTSEPPSDPRRAKYNGPSSSSGSTPNPLLTQSSFNLSDLDCPITLDDSPFTSYESFADSIDSLNGFEQIDSLNGFEQTEQSASVRGSHGAATSEWTFMTPGQQRIAREATRLDEERFLPIPQQPSSPKPFPTSALAYPPASATPSSPSVHHDGLCLANTTTLPLRLPIPSSLALLVSESVAQINIMNNDASNLLAGKTLLELNAHRGIATTAPSSIGGGAKWRVLFLDVDGVLNTSPVGPPLQLPLLERLVGVVLYTDAYIVLSSAWRVLPELREKLLKALHQAGLKMDRVLGQTAVRLDAPRSHVHKQERAGQILDWLDRHHHNVESWVAVDDEKLATQQGGDGLEGHFVQTDAAEGFTMRCV